MTNPTGNRYKIETMQDIMDIPDDALPRFIEELPGIVLSMKRIREAAPQLADDAVSQAIQRRPWLGVIPRAILVRAFSDVIQHANRGTWTDDGTARTSFSMKFTKDDNEPFYHRWDDRA